ncbi:MAG: hypothetical protein ABIK44_00660 [candidate division WOR-3 bacterium]
MKKNVMAVLAASLALGVALAKSGTGGFGGFGPTISMIDFSGLNDALSHQGFDRLGSMNWGMGGAGYAFVRNVVIGGSGSGGVQIVANDSVRCKVEFGGGQFEAGYVLFGNKHLIVAPVLGIGGAGYSITIEPTRGDVPNFDSLLSHPGRKSEVTCSQIALVPELMITVPVSFVGAQLKAGYNFMPGAPTWELSDGGSLNRGPRVAQGYPFLSLHIIFGGMGRQPESRN